MPDQEHFPWLARLLQVNDSAFPTGGYAHSYGFEQIVALGLVRDAESMRSHIENHLWPMLVHFELPVVRFAREAAVISDLDALLELDAIVDATKPARELREASRTTGRRRLHALLENHASPLLTSLADAIQQSRAQGHHAVIFGAGLTELPLRALLASWAFQSISALCLAAPKLLRIGQDSSQRILTASLAATETHVTRSLEVSRDEIGWFDPLLDLASMQHEIAHERLFIS